VAAKSKGREYSCPQCDEVLPKLKHLKHHMRQLKHASATCIDCDEVLITSRELSLHSDETGHEKFTGEVMVANLRELQNLTRVDAGASHEESAGPLSSGSSASNRDDEDEVLHVSLDAQNIVLGHDDAALTDILQQLRVVAEELDVAIELDCIVPNYWLFSTGKGKGDAFKSKIKELSRVIPIQISNKDKEVDDYVVVSLAAARDGFYVSRDSRMHRHIGKSLNWAESHRIDFRRDWGTKHMSLNFPELESLPDGEMCESRIKKAYGKIRSENRLGFEFEEWELQAIAKTDDSIEMRYFCPDCGEKFPKLGLLNTHRKEMAHACLICDDCSEMIAIIRGGIDSVDALEVEQRIANLEQEQIILSKAHRRRHSISFRHENYSGIVYTREELLVQKAEEGIDEQGTAQTDAEPLDENKEKERTRCREILDSMAQSEIEQLVHGAFTKIIGGDDVSESIRVFYVEEKPGVICHPMSDDVVGGFADRFIGHQAEIVQKVRGEICRELGIEEIFFYVRDRIAPH